MAFYLASTFYLRFYNNDSDTIRPIHAMQLHGVSGRTLPSVPRSEAGTIRGKSSCTARYLGGRRLAPLWPLASAHS